MNNSIKILAIICSFSLFTSCESETSTPQDEKSLIVTFEDSLSYSMGINIAQNLPDTPLNTDLVKEGMDDFWQKNQPRLNNCLLYTSPSPRDRTRSRMPSSA